MITRYWRGVTIVDQAEAYERHLKEETFQKLETLDGFINAQILRRNLNEGTEFIILTNWKSMEVIKAFAGERVEKAVVPKKAEAMMIDYDEKVIHYNLSFDTNT